MEAQRVDFLLTMQAKVDLLENKLGKDHPTVNEIKQKFQRLLDRDVISPKRELGVSDTSKVASLNAEVQKIREHLDLRADPSIDYSLIPSERVKKQLLKDNLRMENIRLDSSIKDENERLYSFCVNAFYQIEELLNYYCVKRYSFSELVRLLKNLYVDFDYTKCSTIVNIPMYQKIFFFEKLFLWERYDENGQRIKYDNTLTLIRKIRNEDAHRCSELERESAEIKRKRQELIDRVKKSPSSYIKTQVDKDIEKEANLVDFISEKCYGRIRDIIKDVYQAIVRDLALG